MRVVLVDDHAVVLEGLRSCFDNEPDFEVVAVFGDGASLLEALPEMVVDVVVTDVAMPRMTGIQVAREIADMPAPQPRVIILSMHTDREFVLEAFQAGASGYVVKSSAFGELVSALRAVETGGHYVSPAVSDTLIDSRLGEGEGGASFLRLTPRELQTLQLLADGLSVKEISFELGLSNKTVHAYRNTVMEKLGLKSIAELTKYALRRGLTQIN